MKRVFAILQEPASYTVDRNHAVYDKLGIEYCYINNSSEAKSNEKSVKGLSELTHSELKTRLSDILNNYDIIIMNGYTGPVFRELFKLNRRYGKIIGIDSDTQLRIPSNPLKRLAKWIYLKRIFSDRHYFGLAGGTGSHKELFRHYGMAEERICLMPMIINNNTYASEPKSSNGCRFIFLFVGRIIGLKNIPTMINAFTKAFKNREDVELRLIGDGELLESYKQEYKSFKNIFFAGSKFGSDLKSEYRNASAFILPSSSEQWGLVVNEALAAGLPVIVSDQVGAAHDLVEGKDTGFIFPYQDVDTLANQMRIMVEDKQLYNKFSINASTLMKDYWNYSLYSKCLVEFIEKASKAI